MLRFSIKKTKNLRAKVKIAPLFKNTRLNSEFYQSPITDHDLLFPKMSATMRRREKATILQSLIDVTKVSSETTVTRYV